MPGWPGRTRVRRTCLSSAPPHAGLTSLQALGSRQAAAITAVLSFFTGFLISDGYSAYQQLLPQLAGVQQCCQHVIRRCRAVTKLGPGSLQSWAADAHQAVEEALARGDPALDAELLAKLRQRYDQAVAFGITHNRHRDWHDGNHPGYTLSCWLRDYAGQVWLFTREPGVEWTEAIQGLGIAVPQTLDFRSRLGILRPRRGDSRYHRLPQISSMYWRAVPVSRCRRRDHRALA